MGCFVQDVVDVRKGKREEEAKEGRNLEEKWREIRSKAKFDPKAKVG
jgi:hypothetical protein